MIRRLLLSFTLLGIGLSYPVVSHSFTADRVAEAVPGLADNRPVSTLEPALNIEVVLEPRPDGLAYNDIPFTGKANDVVVVYIAHKDGEPSFLPAVNLYTADGEDVLPSYFDHSSMTFEPSNGSFQTFLLPETGDYRLAFGGEPASSDEIPVIDPDYSVQVRSATPYEQLMVSAENLVAEKQYEEAFDRLALAVDDSPEIPAAYLSRLFAYVEMLGETSDVVARLDALNEEFERDEAPDLAAIESAYLTIIHETFLTLPAADQSVVLSDLQQLDRLFSDAIASGKVTPEEGLEPRVFAGLGDFLATGMPTAVIRQIFFSVGPVEEEPPVEPMEPLEPPMAEPSIEDASPPPTE